MSVMAVAMVGTALIGAEASKSAAGKSAAAAKTQLDFEKAKYQDWQNIYGDMEKNLGDFYSNLTPEFAISQGLEKQQQEYQRTSEQIKERFAQMGVTSGAQADIEARMAMGQAKERATIRAEAPEKVRQQQQSFLSLGVEPSGYGEALKEDTRTAGAEERAEAEAAFGAAGTFAGLWGRQKGIASDAPVATIEGEN